MTQIYSGELQDYEGNTIYPHTESDIVFLDDGSTLKEFLKEASDEELGIMIDAALSN